MTTGWNDTSISGIDILLGDYCRIIQCPCGEKRSTKHSGTISSENSKRDYRSDISGMESNGGTDTVDADPLVLELRLLLLS
jgi:hypothetical protein